MSVLAKLRALSNETRFEIVKLVSKREMTAGAVAEQFKVTRPAVSQHLSILCEAGLLRERRAGTARLYLVRPEGFNELAEFLEGYWRPRLSQLKQAAESIERSKKAK